MCPSLNEVKKNDTYGVSQKGYNDNFSESEGVLHGSKSMPTSMKNMLQSPTMVNMCDILQNKEAANDEKPVIPTTDTATAGTSTEDISSTSPRKLIRIVILLPQRSWKALSKMYLTRNMQISWEMITIIKS